MSLAFKEAKALSQDDPELNAHPLLKEEVRAMFAADPLAVN
jgi:hypothetical protein